jgi:hypothetical protein
MQYTAQAVHEACLVYRKALGDAIVMHLCGRLVRLAPRQFHVLSGFCSPGTVREDT